MNAALIPLLVLTLAVGFDAFCLVDLAGANAVRTLPKLGWGIVICVFTPFGGLAYLSIGRVR